MVIKLRYTMISLMISCELVRNLREYKHNTWSILKHPRNIKNFHLKTSHFLKETKFLVKISLFKFLVMTEKNVFVYKCKCHEIFQIFVYFLCKNWNPLKKKSPPLSQQPSLKIEILSTPPPLFRTPLSLSQFYYFGFIYLFSPYYLFCSCFLSIWKFLCCCSSFHWRFQIQKEMPLWYRTAYDYYRDD